MIIAFKVKNFRSFKEEAVLSLEASGSKAKLDNIAEVITAAGKTFRLLKSIVIYGANASGKSNVIKAYWAFRQLIVSSFRNDINDDIKLAEPFLLAPETIIKPSEFTLNFIGWDKRQYIYYVSLSRTDGIIEETLKYYPKHLPKIVFKRKGRNIITRNPDIFKQNSQTDKINPKRLFLSELGNSGDEYWEQMRNYFVLGTNAVNAIAAPVIQAMSQNARRLFEHTDPQSTIIKEQVVRMIRVADLGIKSLKLVEEERIVKSPVENEDSFSGPVKTKVFKTYHDVFENHRVVDEREFDLAKQGSTGTFSLVGLSTEIFLSLNFRYGKPLWIDEFNNSLHPYLCRFLISLYHHPKSNPNNAQLIFATHETTLLDKNYFRKDQIYITTKDRYGCSNLYSIYDLELEGLRDDIPFDKWYMAGKFGGLPRIKELDFIFEREH